MSNELHKRNKSNSSNLGSKTKKLWENEEYRKKMSDAHKSQKAWNKGRKETRANVLKKQSEAQKGEKSILWKGGITPINEAARKNLEYKLWRKSCLLRDNFTCQKCSTNGNELRVHHINNFSDFPELRYEITNGITLCHNCHMNFHNKYSRKNNTLEQLQEFLNEK